MLTILSRSKSYARNVLSSKVETYSDIAAPRDSSCSNMDFLCWIRGNTTDQNFISDFSYDAIYSQLQLGLPI